MKTSTRRALSFVLTLAMLFSMAMPTAFAAEPVVTAEKAYSDIAGHWAEKPIERWDDYGIVSGFGEEFRPNGTITRGQMASILSNLLNLTEEAENTFSDVPEGKWYTTFVLRCVKAGIMAGANGKAMPEKEITRQEAMTMLCQALGIEPKADADLSKYTDADQMARWAKPFVGALVEAGIVSGVSADKLGSLSSMSRGAVMTVLDKAVAQYINTPGTYELTDKEGIVLVASDDVKLTGETKATILVSSAVDKNTVTREEEEVVMGGGGGGGIVPPRPVTPPAPTVNDLDVTSDGAFVSGGTYKDVTITDAVGNGTVLLSNLTINGDLIIEGGGSGTVKVHDCTIHGKVVMNKVHSGADHQDPRVHLHDTEVKEIVVSEAAIIDAEDQNSTIDNIVVNADVTIQGKDTNVKTVVIPENANPNALKVKGNSKIEKVQAKSEVNIIAESTSEGAVIGEVIAEAPVTVPAIIVEKVEVPATADTNVSIGVTGDDTVDVTVNSDKGAEIKAEVPNKVQVSTEVELSTETSITVNTVPVEHFHKWGTGVETSTPTCTQAGIKTYTCEADGCTDPVATKTETIAMKKHGEVKVPAVAATCTESGLSEGSKCPDCNAVVLTQVVIPAKGHTEVVDAAVAPTCTEDGKTAGKHCSVCNAVTVAQQVDPKKGHDMTEKHFDAAGHWTECTRCDEKSEAVAHTLSTKNCAQEASCNGCDYVKPAGEHAWNQGEVTKEATCTVAGIKTFTCKADGCGTTSTEAIAAKGHSLVTDAAVEATCTASGLTEGSHCSICNHVEVKQETVDMKGHAWDGGKVIKEATLHEEGTRLFTCGTCGATKEESIPVIQLIGKNGYDLKVSVDSFMLIEVTAPAGTDSDKKYSFEFYNSNDPEMYEGWGDRRVDATYGLPCTEGTYDVFRLGIYENGEIKEIVAEFFMEKPIQVKEDSFELTQGSITVTRTPYEKDVAKEQYYFEGLDWSRYNYEYGKPGEGGILVGSETPVCEKGSFETAIGFYAFSAREEADKYVSEKSKELVVTIIDKTEADLEDEQLISDAEDMELLDYLTDTFEMDAAITRLDAARLIAALDKLQLQDNVNLDFADCANLSAQDKAIIKANVDAKYFLPKATGEFDPDGTVSRAQITQIFELIYEVEGGVQYEKDLTDVTYEDWYHENAMSFYNLGIIEVENSTFHGNDPLLMRDALKWMINAREWDRTEHVARSANWEMVKSEKLHAKVCDCCGFWVEREGHDWKDGVISADGKQITQECSVCGFEWTTDYAGVAPKVSNVSFERDDDSVMWVVWDKPVEMSNIDSFNVVLVNASGEAINTVGVSADGESMLDVPNLGGPRGTYTIRIVTVPEESSGMEESYVDTDLTLTITKGQGATTTFDAIFTKLDNEDNAYIFRCNELDTSVVNGHYNLALSIMNGDEREGCGGHGFELGTRDKLIDGRNLDDVIENGQYRIQTFVYELSQNNKECTFTVTNLSDWTDCNLENSGDGSGNTTLSGITSSGDYPVSNIHFENGCLAWTAPQGAPEGMYYMIEVSPDGKEWWNIMGTDRTTQFLAFAAPGEYYIRVICAIWDEQDGDVILGTTTDYDNRLVVKRGNELTNITFEAEYRGQDDNQEHCYEIVLGGLTPGRQFNLDLFIPNGPGQGNGNTSDNTGMGKVVARDFEMKNIMDNGCYEVYEFYNHTLSNNGKTLTYTCDYTEAAVIPAISGELTPLTGTAISGPYPVSNIRFENNRLEWTAPVDGPERVEYWIQTSTNGRLWDHLVGTGEVYEDLAFANPGTYYVRVVTAYYDSEVGEWKEIGWSVDYDMRFVVVRGSQLENFELKIQDTGKGTTEEPLYRVSVSSSAIDTNFILDMFYDGSNHGWRGCTDDTGAATWDTSHPALKNIVENGDYKIFTFPGKNISDEGKTLTITYDYSGVFKCSDTVSDDPVVDDGEDDPIAPETVSMEITSMEQTGMSIKIGFKLPEDTTNIDYFTFTLYEEGKKEESSMTGITCSVTEPFFYVSKDRFNDEYLYDTAEITAIAKDGSIHSVWSDRVYMAQRGKSTTATYTYNPNNSPAPLLTINFVTSAPGFYQIVIGDGNDLNKKAYADTVDGTSICCNVSEEEAATILNGSATLTVSGWNVTQLERQDDGKWKIDFTKYDVIVEVPEESENNVVWVSPGVLTWNPIENADKYVIIISEKEYMDSGARSTKVVKDTSYNLLEHIASIAHEEDDYLSVRVVALDVDYNKIEEVGQLVDAIKFYTQGEVPEYTIDIGDDSKTYKITFGENVPEGVCHIIWDTSISGESVFEYNTVFVHSNQVTYERENPFNENDKLQLQIFYNGNINSNGTEWTVLRTSISSR